MSSITSLDSHLSSYTTSDFSTTTDSSDPIPGHPTTFHSRAPSLSIDPKLFQPKITVGDMEVDDGDGDGVGEDEEGEGMKTAVPALPKSPAAKSKKVKGGVRGMVLNTESDGKKKVSHARKVS
jgi:hypothetical protein